MNYYFCDFTQRNYKKLLRLAKQTYRFISYEEAKKKKGKYILLRHDVDFSPHSALSLAQIEHALGIKSTYCLQLGSIFYNTFEKDIKEIFLKIKKLKHCFGLHFDPALYDIKSFNDMEKFILYEKKVLEQLLGCKIGVVSFHDPTYKDLKIADFRIAGLINAYSEFFMSETKYISDSNGYWRFERLQDILSLKKYEKLHILIHPGWWQKSVMSPWSRLQRCVEGRKKSALRQYRKLLFRAGRKNIGYESDNIR